METLFSEKLIEGCIASESEMQEAKLHGQRFVSESVDGKVIAYEYNGKVYVADIQIVPE